MTAANVVPFPNAASTRNRYTCPICGTKDSMWIWHGPDGESASAHCNGPCSESVLRIQAIHGRVQQFVSLIGGEE